MFVPGRNAVWLACVIFFQWTDVDIGVDSDILELFIEAVVFRSGFLVVVILWTPKLNE